LFCGTSFSLPHPHPPSFPTRRSSDLSEYGIRCNNLSPGAYPKVAAPAAVPNPGAPNQVKDNDFLSILNSKTSLKRTGRPEDLFRSEEHTSELQSRRDLVCRLLLHKKN